MVLVFHSSALTVLEMSRWIFKSWTEDEESRWCWLSPKPRWMFPIFQPRDHSSHHH
jgi:hypothetical protein